MDKLIPALHYGLFGEHKRARNLVVAAQGIVFGGA